MKESIVALMGAIVLAVPSPVAVQTAKKEPSAVNAKITDGTTTVDVSDLKLRYIITTRRDPVTSHSPSWDLATLYISISGRTGSSFWNDQLAFELTELKRLEYEGEYDENGSRREHGPRLQIEKRDGSIRILVAEPTGVTGPGYFEERNSSGETLKRFPISHWEYGGKIGGDTAEGSSMSFFVGRVQTPLGTPGDFSLNDLAMRRIDFYTEVAPSR